VLKERKERKKKKTNYNQCKKIEGGLDLKAIINDYKDAKKNFAGFYEDLIRDGPFFTGVRVKDGSKWTVKMSWAIDGTLLEPTGCRTTGTHDHRVLLVGYEENGDDKAWLLKNSWGSASSHVKISAVANGGNFCGIFENSQYLYHNDNSKHIPSATSTQAKGQPSKPQGKTVAKNRFDK